VILEISLHGWCATYLQSEKGAVSRLRSGISTMASSRLGYWTMTAKRERECRAWTDSNAPAFSLEIYVLRRLKQSPQAAAVR